jgi:hypothetical protein
VENKSNDFYFDILGVNRKSTKDVIKQAFRDLIKKWHPDKFLINNDANHEATEKSKLIIEAYRVLKNYEPPKLQSPNTYYPTDSIKKKSSKVRQEILRTRVKSSNIHSVGYDCEKSILQVEFSNGGVYEYYGVPEIIFKDFMNSVSKGKYANRNIFYSYRYSRV